MTVHTPIRLIHVAMGANGQVNVFYEHAHCVSMKIGIAPRLKQSLKLNNAPFHVVRHSTKNLKDNFH